RRVLFRSQVEGDAGVGQDNILLLRAADPGQDAGQRVHTAGIDLDAALGIGREHVQAAALAGQVPFTAGAQVVHQRVVVAADNDRDIVDAGVCHAGQHKVDHAVTAAEGNGV